MLEYTEVEARVAVEWKFESFRVEAVV